MSNCVSVQDYVRLHNRRFHLRRLIASLYLIVEDDVKRIIDEATGAWLTFGKPNCGESLPYIQLDDLQLSQGTHVRTSDYAFVEADYLRGKALIHRIFHMHQPLSLVRRTISCSAPYSYNDAGSSCVKPNQPSKHNYRSADFGID